MNEITVPPDEIDLKYEREMLIELQKMAAQKEFSFLAYLIGVAVAEIDDIQRSGSQRPSKLSSTTKGCGAGL